MCKNTNKSDECENNSANLYHSISENTDLIQNEKKAKETLHLDDVNIRGKKSSYKMVDEDDSAINSLRYVNNIPEKNKEEKEINNLDNVEKTEIDIPENRFGFSNVDENGKL